MGICPCLAPRDPAEKMIIAKEETLKLSTFSIGAIKNAFFDLNDKECISYANVLKGLKRLQENVVGFDDFLKDDSVPLKNLQAVLKGISINDTEPDIKKNVFKFKQMMTVFLLLSKNISKDKIQEILRMEGKEKFTPTDLSKVMKEIFVAVIDCSLQLLVSDMEQMKRDIESKKFKMYKSNVNIDNVIEQSVKEIFNGSSDKTPVELGYMFYQLVGKLQYDAASTDGIRKILKGKPQEKEQAQEEQPTSGEQKEIKKEEIKA